MAESSKRNQVTLFARVDSSLNPYILLYKRAIESQGLTAVWEREFGLRWSLLRSRDSQVVHLHWIESAYLPVPRAGRSKFWRWMRRKRVVMTVLAALGLGNFLAALFLARLSGRWIVYTANDLDAHSSLPWPLPWLRWCAQTAVCRVAHRLHAHCGEAGETLRAACGGRTPVVIIPNGNYLGAYANRISRQDARRALNLPVIARVYLFFGLLRPYKGVDELIRAFREIASPARLLVAGRAYASDYAESLSRLCGDDPRIDLRPGFVPDDEVQVYMKACDVSVLPYREASSSGAAMLAFSFGRPVVAPSIGYFRDVVIPGTGILYDPGRRGALTSALADAGEVPWCDSEILQHARRFDWEVLGPRLVQELYEQAG